MYCLLFRCGAKISTQSLTKPPIFRLVPAYRTIQKKLNRVNPLIKKKIIPRVQGTRMLPKRTTATSVESPGAATTATTTTPKLQRAPILFTYLSGLHPGYDTNEDMKFNTDLASAQKMLFWFCWLGRQVTTVLDCFAGIVLPYLYLGNWNILLLIILA